MAQRSQVEFTEVTSIRTFDDGRVLVVDALDRSVVVVDLDTDLVSRVSRIGRGPGEYTGPKAAFAFAGDSTLLVDFTDPYGVLMLDARALPARRAVLASGEGLDRVHTFRNAADMRGGFYAQVPRVVPGSGFSDSSALVRYDLWSGQRDTLMWWNSQPVSPLLQADPGRGRPIPAAGLPQRAAVPFVTRSEWAVSSSGTIALVHPDPYRVTLRFADGSVVEGPELPITKVHVNEGHKAYWRRLQERPSMGTQFRGSEMAVVRIPKPNQEPDQWPMHVPAFLERAVLIDDRDVVWVRRTPAIDEPPVYDLIGTSGTIIGRCAVPVGARVAGFGKGTVYVVRVDDDGLERLERHASPTS